MKYEEINCQVRQASSNLDAKHYDTERIRKEYLVENVMVPDEINMVYSMFDRIIAGGAVPVKEDLLLSAPDILRADYFTQRRELGIINVGGAGTVVVGEEEYHLEYKEALYVGRGNRHVTFKSDSADKPAHFYFCSATAHRETGVKKVTKKDAVVMHLGSLEESNERTINRLLVKEVVPCCQLQMGMTELAPGQHLEHHAGPHPRPPHGGLFLLRAAGRPGCLPLHGRAAGDPPHLDAQRAGRHLPAVEHPLRLRDPQLHLHLGHVRRERRLQRHGLVRNH